MKMSILEDFQRVARKTTLSLVAAITLAGGGTAFAQSNNNNRFDADAGARDAHAYVIEDDSTNAAQQQFSKPWANDIRYQNSVNAKALEAQTYIQQQELAAQTKREAAARARATALERQQARYTAALNRQLGTAQKRSSDRKGFDGWDIVRTVGDAGTVGRQNQAAVETINNAYAAAITAIDNGLAANTLKAENSLANYVARLDASYARLPEYRNATTPHAVATIQSDQLNTALGQTQNQAVLRLYQNYAAQEVREGRLPMSANDYIKQQQEQQQRAQQQQQQQSTINNAPSVNVAPGAR